MGPTPAQDHDAPHCAAGRDLVAKFVGGCRVEGILPFFYHTTLDWYQPSFQSDVDAYLDYLHKSLEVLCTHYGEIGGLWFDGNWSKPDADWKQDRLYGLIRRLQPRGHGEIWYRRDVPDDESALGHWRRRLQLPITG